jgi:hypothetical protein
VHSGPVPSARVDSLCSWEPTRALGASIAWTLAENKASRQKQRAPTTTFFLLLRCRCIPSTSIEEGSHSKYHQPSLERVGDHLLCRRALSPASTHYQPRTVRLAPPPSRTTHAPDAINDAPDAINNALDAINNAPDAINDAHAPDAINNNNAIVPDAIAINDAHPAPDADREQPDAINDAPSTTPAIKRRRRGQQKHTTINPMRNNMLGMGEEGIHYRRVVACCGDSRDDRGNVDRCYIEPDGHNNHSHQLTQPLQLWKAETNPNRLAPAKNATINSIIRVSKNDTNKTQNGDGNVFFYKKEYQPKSAQGTGTNINLLK